MGVLGLSLSWGLPGGAPGVQHGLWSIALAWSGPWARLAGRVQDGVQIPVNDSVPFPAATPQQPRSGQRCHQATRGLSSGTVGWTDEREEVGVIGEGAER